MDAGTSIGAQPRSFFACSICLHLENAPTWAEMHGEGRTRVGQAEGWVVARGREEGVLRRPAWLPPRLSIFVVPRGEEDQQRIRLTWPLRRGGFPDEQPSVA